MPRLIVSCNCLYFFVAIMCLAGFLLVLVGFLLVALTNNYGEIGIPFFYMHSFFYLFPTSTKATFPFEFPPLKFNIWSGTQTWTAKHRVLPFAIVHILQKHFDLSNYIRLLKQVLNSIVLLFRKTVLRHLKYTYFPYTTGWLKLLILSTIT